MKRLWNWIRSRLLLYALALFIVGTQLVIMHFSRTDVEPAQGHCVWVK